MSRRLRRIRGKRGRVRTFRVAPALKHVIVEGRGPGPDMALMLGSDLWIVVNASYDGTDWNRISTSLASRALVLRGNGDLQSRYAAAGANPISWTTAAAHTL